MQVSAVARTIASPLPAQLPPFLSWTLPTRNPADLQLSLSLPHGRTPAPPALAMSDRLGLEPAHRVVLLGGLAGIYGLFHGVAKGAKLASFRYLAENAHRLPRTKGTWYFFHKRKNYVLLKEGMNSGALLAVKYGGVTAAFFGTEAALDHELGVSWVSTAGAAAVVGTAVAATQRLGARQAVRSVRNFVLFGAAAGLVQDRVRGQSAASRQQRAERHAEQSACEPKTAT